MNQLHFVHQFFHFSIGQWESFCAGSIPSREKIAGLFSTKTFAARQLRTGTPTNMDEALRLYEEILQIEDKLKIQSTLYRENDYPLALNQFLSPAQRPPLLSWRGKLPSSEVKSIAIVGTRRPSAMGKSAAASFARYFCSLGLEVTSGLAFGIDAIAHQTALQAPTIGVLGCGLSEIYPTEHCNLAEDILNYKGGLLSPFGVFEIPAPYNFPKRNALIAALSAGTVVVEGSEKSGAAITGKLALEMGKAVVTLTQDFRTAYGIGAIRLVEAGATLCTNEQEALQAIYSRMGGFSAQSLPSSPFTTEELRAKMQVGLYDAIQIIEASRHEGVIHKNKEGKWQRNSRLP